MAVLTIDELYKDGPSSNPAQPQKRDLRDTLNSKFSEVDTKIADGLESIDAAAISAKANGAEEGTDASTILMTLAGDGDLVRISADLTADSATQRTIRDVTFVGEGSLSGVYRKFVIPERAGIFSPSSNDLTTQHVSRLTSKSNPVVVLVGDSLSTYWANSTGRQDTLAMQIQTACRNVLREDQTLTFHNRGVNGMTYAAFYSGSTTSDPSDDDSIEWWNDGTTWNAQVEALDPDIIFFAFGMNDTSDILPSIVDSLLDDLATWDSNPEVVLCSNMLPSLGANALYATRAEQDGRDMAAGITRTMAKYRGIGLLDMHRTFCAARDGFDPCRSTITSTEVAAVVSGTQLLCPDETIDFTAEFTVDLDDFVAGSSTTVVALKLGTMDLDWFRIAKTSGDLMQFQLSSGPSATAYNYKTTTTTWPGTGEVTYRVEVKNNIITLYRLDAGGTGGAYSQPLFTSKLVRGGGFFQPAVFMAAGGSQIFSDVSFYISRPRLYMPTIRDKDLFAGTDGEGSLYNHGGNYISAHIYGPTIEAACFGPNYRPRELFGSATWNPGSLAAAASEAFNVTVTGAKVSNTFVEAIHHTSIVNGATGNGRWLLYGNVIADDTVQVSLENRSGTGPHDLGSGTVYVRCSQHDT